MQRLSRADGVAQVTINGADKPAIRVRLDPVRLAVRGDVLGAVEADPLPEPDRSLDIGDLDVKVVEAHDRRPAVEVEPL